MRKMDGVRARLQPPVLEGPAGAEVTLIGWGSTWSVIHEAAEQLTGAGHHREPAALQVPASRSTARRRRPSSQGCQRTVVVESNFTGQFARHLRAESGFSVDHVLVRYDGEPFEPA